ncbi:MAG: hypothetical protein KAS32_16600, partial [Candidatus Peribacteraceae bacterium]|nr:hypothetical protein [Candidatus Peribacteraceae bacterium]
MIDFLKGRRVGKGKKASIFDMSKIAREEREKILREKIRGIITEEFENSGINQRIVDISNSVKSTEKMIEKLKSSLVPLSRTKSDSIRKIKMK